MLACLCFVFMNAQAQSYTPAKENLKARSSYQDLKFGMFIHWGIASVLDEDM